MRSSVRQIEVKALLKKLVPMTFILILVMLEVFLQVSYLPCPLIFINFCIFQGSTTAVKLQKFFDKVIERKYFSKENSTFYDRNRTARLASRVQSPPIDSTNRYFSPFTSPVLGNYSNFSADLATSVNNLFL